MKPKKNVEIPYQPRKLQLYIHNQLDRHRFGVIVAHRRFGKTVLAVNQLIKAAFNCPLHSPRFAYIAPYYSQAKEIAWDYVKRFTAPIPGAKTNESELFVNLPSVGEGGARLKLYGADRPDSLRGIYLDGVVIDEVAQCRPELWGEVIRPLLADRQGWCCFIGTPQGRNLFFDLYHNASGLPGWYAESFPVTVTGVIPQDELDAAKLAMAEDEYAQEFLCSFNAKGHNILISPDLAVAASKKVPPPSTWTWAPVVIGVDVARFGGDKSVIYVRQGLHSLSLETYQNMDLMTFSEHVVTSIMRYKPKIVFVDMAGIGAGVVDRLLSMGYSMVIGINAGSTPDNRKYKNKRAEMWDRMKEWLMAGGDLPDIGELIAQITSVEYDHDPADRLLLESKRDMKRRGLPSSDLADAISLTFAIKISEQPSVDTEHFDSSSKAVGTNTMTGY